MKTRPLFFLLTIALSAAVVVTPPLAANAAGEKTSAAKPYPLTVCIVTDNDLGSMGDEQAIVHEGQTIKFCCAPCVSRFRKNPAKYLGKLTQDKKSESAAVPGK